MDLASDDQKTAGWNFEKQRLDLMAEQLGR